MSPNKITVVNFLYFRSILSSYYNPSPRGSKLQNEAQINQAKEQEGENEKVREESVSSSVFII
jgi:hypothetical protein